MGGDPVEEEEENRVREGIPTTQYGIRQEGLLGELEIILFD